MSSHPQHPAHDGEVCQSCRKPVSYTVGTWWQAPDDLWQRIYGHGGGIRCPRCFALDCIRAGVPIHFEAVPDV